jgi:hypothetical protein
VALDEFHILSVEVGRGVVAVGMPKNGLKMFDVLGVPGIVDTKASGF